ncbi:MAG: hypothetical protein HC906_02150 [Bacteroidales bacterium]|nr:hypothetical protein [Bacteroidales bacterium]
MDDNKELNRRPDSRDSEAPLKFHKLMGRCCKAVIIYVLRRVEPEENKFSHRDEVYIPTYMKLLKANVIYMLYFGFLSQSKKATFKQFSTTFQPYLNSIL